MDREDAVPIVEARDRVHVGAVEQVTAKAGRASVGDDARREHEADPSTPSRQLQRSFEEQLVAIDVRASLDVVDAGFSHEISEAPRLGSAAPAQLRLAAVTAHHVPRRIADHGVETGIRQRCPVLVREHLGEGERPVEKTVVGGNRVSALDER